MKLCTWGKTVPTLYVPMMRSKLIFATHKIWALWRNYFYYKIPIWSDKKLLFFLWFIIVTINTVNLCPLLCHKNWNNIYQHNMAYYAVGRETKITKRQVLLKNHVLEKETEEQRRKPRLHSERFQLNFRKKEEAFELLCMFSRKCSPG